MAESALPKGGAAEAPPKRSFFTNARPEITLESGDIFSRKNRLFDEILEEERRKRTLKATRKHKPSLHRGGREHKRRKVSSDDEDRSDQSSPGLPTKSLPKKDSALDFSHSFESKLPKRRPETQTEAPQAYISPCPSGLTSKLEAPKTSAVVIDLEGSESEQSAGRGSSATDKHGEPPSKEKRTHKEVLQEDSEDEEFRELAAQARERRRLRTVETAVDTKSSEVGRFVSGAAAQINPASSNTLPQDSVIQVLITSRIPNTKPLIVHRKLSQRLQEIRTLWCSKQGFSKEFSASVFLTWRNRRLYDVTTCKSLGIRVDGEGKVIQHRGFGEMDGKVHVEAMTDEIFEDAKRQGRNGLSFKQPGQDDDEEEEEADEERRKLEANSPAGPAEDQVRIKLKARDYEELKLIVKPTTTISRIAEAFRKGRSVPTEKEVVLMFDGERLDPQLLVQDSEVSDMDSIEVHVR